MGWGSDIQLLKLPLRLPPERSRPFVQAPPFLGELDQAASAVRGRRLDRDEAVAFQEANHFPHRRSFDSQFLGLGDRRWIRDIDPDRHNARLVETARVAHARIDFRRPATTCLSRNSQTQAAIGTGEFQEAADPARTK